MEYTPNQIDSRIKADKEMQALAQNDETEFLARHAQIYREFGYNHDGTPLRTAQKLIGKTARATGIPEGVVQFGTSAVLPTIGAVAGMAVGRAGGPAGAIAGASGGSVLGEAANSLLGITDPMDKTDMVIAAGAPLLGPLASRTGPAAIKAGKRILPGVGAGLNELAGDVLTKKLSSMRVRKEDVEAARAGLSMAADFKMHAPNTKAIFTEESAKVAQQALMGVPDSEAYLKALNKVIKSSGVGGKDKVNFKDLMTLEEGFNRIKGGKPDEIWAAASGKIIDDIEKASLDPALHPNTAAKAAKGLQQFKSFIAINRKHHADETLVNMFTPGKGILKPSSGNPDLIQFDQKAFKLKLQNDATLKKAFTPDELNSVMDSIKDLGYIGKIPNTSNTPMGLGSRYGAGGLAGFAIAGPAGALAGAGVEELLRSAVSSETGRRVVKHLAKEGRGRISALELQSVLGQVLAGATAGSVAGIRSSSPESSVPFANEQ
jgi:hypothetical protein